MLEDVEEMERGKGREEGRIGVGRLITGVKSEASYLRIPASTEDIK